MQINLNKKFTELEIKLCKRLEQLQQDVLDFKIQS